MPGPTLWLPYGLYALELCRVTQENPQCPFALLDRTPVDGTIHVAVRPSEGRPEGDIVDVAYRDVSAGCLPLKQTVGADGEVTLSCPGYQEVKIIPCVLNLDILSRSGKFMAAVVLLLHIDEPTAPSLNLRPFHDFHAWWVDPTKSLDATTNWDGIEPWIRQAFEERQRRIDAYDGQSSNDPIKIELPQCFTDLERELLFSEDLSRALLAKLRNLRDALAPQMTDRDLIEMALANQVISTFRNSKRHFDRCLDETDPDEEPNWFGFAYLSAWRAAERRLKALAAGRVPPQLPLKQYRALKTALKNPFRSIEEALTGLTPCKTLNRKKSAYYSAKKIYLVAHDYLAQLAVIHFTNGHDPDNLRIARIGLSRAVDQWCHDATSRKQTDPPPPAGSFQAFANVVMRCHLLELRGQERELKLEQDEQILADLPLVFNPVQQPLPQDGQLVDRGNQNPEARVQEEERRRHAAGQLRVLISLARLTPEESHAILTMHGLTESSLWGAHAAAKLPPMTTETLEHHEKAAFKKLQEAKSQFVDEGSLRYLIRGGKLSPEEIQAALGRYAIIRDDLSDSEKDAIRHNYGVEPTLPTKVAKLLDDFEKAAFGKLKKAPKAMLSDRPFRHNFRMANLEPEERLAVLWQLNMITEKMNEKRKESIRKNFDVEPRLPDRRDGAEFELVRRRAFQKLEAAEHQD